MSGDAPIGLVIISGARPDLLAATLDSFGAGLLRRFAVQEVIANIDPVFGDAASIAACRAVILERYPQAEVVTPATPGFGRAVRTAWSLTRSPWVFHLEDDWRLDEAVDPAILAHFDDPAVVEVSFLNVEKRWVFERDGPFYVRASRRRVLGVKGPERAHAAFTLSPAFFRGSFVRACSRLMRDDLDPEKQFAKYHNPALQRYASRFRHRLVMGASGHVVADTGRVWREARQIDKTTQAGVSTWGERRALPDAATARSRRPVRHLVRLAAASGAACLALITATVWLSSALPRWLPEFSATASTPIAMSELGPPPASLADLPLRVSPATDGLGLALVLSDSKGWDAVDHGLVDGLEAAHWTVAGLNSEPLFGLLGRPRTPEDIAGVLAKVIDALRLGGRPVVLVGEGFGADVMATSYASMPAAIRQDIRRVILVKPTRHVYYALGAARLVAMGEGEGAHDVAAAMLAMPAGVPVCIVGKKHNPGKSPCLEPAQSQIATILLPGGRHFGGRYRLLAQTVVEHL